MSTKQIQALVYRWPAPFAEKLKAVADDKLSTVNSLVYNLIRSEVESEYKRIQREREQIAELEESR
jgi:hypothetical protein